MNPVDMLRQAIASRTPCQRIVAVAATALIAAAGISAWAWQGHADRRGAPPGMIAAQAATVQTPGSVSRIRGLAARAAATRYVQFEPNRGQAAKTVRYLARGPGHGVEVFDDGLALSMSASAARDAKAAGTRPASARLSFIGASSAREFEAREPAPGQAHYLVGADATKWVQGVSSFRQLRQTGIYPGIDLVYYSRDGELEFDFVVSAGADPSRIRWHVDGAQAPVVDDDGELFLDGRNGSLRLHRPVLYQSIDGQKRVLDAHYVISRGREVSLALPAYDKRYPLVIDPVFKLLYSTYLTGFHDDQVGGMTLDAKGNAYVVGQSNSDDFAVSANAYQTGKSTSGLQYNVIVSKFDASGTLIYSSYLGGTGSDIGTAIAVDAAGNAYVTGNTTSPDFPVTAGAHQPVMTGSPSAFLSVLSPDGSALAYSTFYGGAGSAQAQAIALDASGAAVIAGTAGPGLATTAGAYKGQLAAGKAAFVARFSPLAGGAPRLVAASYYGVDSPQANDVAQGNTALSMALDANGSPWITGQAFTTNLPLTATPLQAAPGAMSQSCAPGPGPLNSFAYVARLSPDFASLLYASYLSGGTEPVGGTSCSEFGRALAVDPTGDVYLVGGTGSAAFPTSTGAVQPTTPAGGSFAAYVSFAAKLRGDGSALRWSTYFGGNVGNTFLGAIALDPGAGAVWATSVTSGGSNYPLTADALQSAHGGGGADVGIAQFDAASGALKYSTYLGGSAADVGLALAVDAGGNAFVAGNTYSPDFPVTSNAYDKTFRPDVFRGGDWFFSILGNGVLGQVSPASAGNGGDATLTLSGSGFQDGARCQLVAGVATLGAFEATVAVDGTQVVCRFQLAGSAAVAYDVSVVNPDGSVLKRSAAFTVRDAPAGTVPSDLWIDLVGRATMRAGVSSDVSVVYGSNGPNDVYSVPVMVSWPASLGLSVTVDRDPIPDLRNGGNLNLGDGVISAQVGGRVYMPLSIPFIGAGRTGSFPLHVVGTLLDADYDLRVEMSQPRFTAMADLIALRDGTSMASAHLLRSLGLPSAAHSRARIGPQGVTNGEIVNCIGSMLSLATSAVPGGPCVQAVAGAVAQNVVQAASNSANGRGHQVTSDAEGIAAGVLNAVPCAISIIPGGSLVNVIATIVGAGQNLSNVGGACGNITGIIAGGIFSGRIRGALDPNDKSGALGDGTPRHAVRSRPFTYQIAFENQPTASLPAARVVITDPLDARSVDLSTLTLGNIHFGGHDINVPPGLASYATTMPIDTTLAVRVQGSVDRTTGILKWTFDSIDPATGLPPSDPTLGFLPPDTDGRKGQGSVSFTIAPVASLAEGSSISNAASIVFDSNPPIATPTWLNTLDQTAPTSKIQALTGKPGTTSFDAMWSSPVDAGSAIRRYSVFVSDNGGPFAIWQNAVTATSATYDGVSGHSYSFYVTAIDGAGNAEADKSAAEATISVSGAFADPTVGTSSDSGGCTIGGDGQRDASLLLLVAIAACLRLIAWRRAATRRRRAAG